ncbi:DUF2062 domain-containing protein [Candidatus Woesearchaeota archaeon]|nr:DUF2062 domain-containing protein [Candidatus Woesearchaeota archaeon]
MRRILLEKEKLVKLWKEHKFKDLLKLIATGNNTPHQVALGSAIGLFVSIIPTFVVGMLIALYIAWDRKLNMLSTFLGTMIVNPFTFPFVYFADYTLGDYIISHKIPLSFPTSQPITAYASRLYLGGFVFAVIASIILYIAVYYVAKYYQEKHLNEKIKGIKIFKKGK